MSATAETARSRVGGRHRTVHRLEPRTSIRLTPRAAILFMVVLLVLTFGVQPLRAYLGERATVAQLEAQTTRLQTANGGLEERIARLNDPAFLEVLARKCLGMVRSGETAFVIVSRQASPRPPAC